MSMLRYLSLKRDAGRAAGAGDVREQLLEHHAPRLLIKPSEGLINSHTITREGGKDRERLFYQFPQQLIVRACKECRSAESLHCFSMTLEPRVE